MAWVAEGSGREQVRETNISAERSHSVAPKTAEEQRRGFFFDSTLPKAGYVILSVKSIVLNMPLILEVIPHAEDQVMRIIGRICIRERIRRGVKAKSCVIELPLAK